MKPSFLQKIKVKKIKVASAAISLGSLRGNGSLFVPLCMIIITAQDKVDFEHNSG